MANVTLRWRDYRDGSKVAYLDIYHGKGIKRVRKLIDIKIKKSDKDKKAKRKKAKQILLTYQDKILNQKHGIISDEKRYSDFLNYFKSYIEQNNNPSIRKYIWAFNTLIEYLIQHQKLPNVTQKNQNTKLIEYKGELLFLSIDENFCKNFKYHVYNNLGLKGESPFTLIKQFRSIINKAAKDHYFNDSPFKGIKLEKPKIKLRKNILTPSEIKLLFATPYPHKELKRVVAFALHTGMPEKECKEITFGHFKDNALNIDRAKSGEPVVIHLSKTALAAIGKFGKPSQKVFNLPSNTTIKKHLQKWIKLAGIEKHITFYCLRHSYAVNLLNEGTNLKTVADLMGHTNTDQTIKYLKYTDSLKTTAIDKLDDIDI